MSRSAHLIYLSIIGVPIAAVSWLVFAVPSEGRGDPVAIAVLPFVTSDADRSANRVADSITAKVVEALARHPRFKVTSRTATEPFIEPKLGSAAIGEALAVARVLEGSVRPAGDRMRVTVQLIDVPSEAHLWSSTYDRDVEDLNSVAADIATSVTSFGYE